MVQETKGAIPLVECTLSKLSDGKKKHTFVLSSPSIKKDVVLLANSDEEMEDWIKKITNSTKQPHLGLL
jgi:hypothetical protein